MANRFVDNSRKILAEFDNAEQRALIRIGMAVESSAKSRCPVDTGRLRNSITFSLSGYGVNSKNVYAKPKGAEWYRKVGKYSSGVMGVAEDKEVYIGTNVEYAPYVEYGTRKKPEPRPFLHPALEYNKNKIKRILEQELKGI